MSRAVLTRIDQFKSRPVSWLWPHRIPLAKVTMLAGDPGLGKSFITTWLAAQVSRGENFPDGRTGLRRPGSVIFLSGEDDPSDTIRPRLEMHNADLKLCHVLEGVRVGDRERVEPLNLDQHMSVLEHALRSIDRPRLVVVDPITAYMGDADANSNAEVRAMLRELSMLAAKYGPAIVCVTHLSKGAAGTKVVYRSMGSLAFVAAARAVYYVTEGTGDTAERFVLPVKSNLDLKTSGLSYIITEQGLAWKSTDVDIKADDAEDTGKAVERGQFEEACDLLAQLLANGPMPASELLKTAEAAGIGAGTLRRAKKKLGAKAFKGPGKNDAWMWCLGGKAGAPASPDAPASPNQLVLHRGQAA